MGVAELKCPFAGGGDFFGGGMGEDKTYHQTKWYSIVYWLGNLGCDPYIAP